MTDTISKPQLGRIDLSTNSRNTLAALITLLAPHVPHSLHVLGTILNTGPRTSTLQDVDPSKVSLWSTIPLPFDGISSTDSPALFSIVTFSHMKRQFSIFYSGDSKPSSDAPTEAEKMHITQIFEYLRIMAHEARPTYDSTMTVLGGTGTTSRLAHHTDTYPPMLVVGGVHEKWAEVLAPLSTRQIPVMQHVYPHGAFVHDGLRTKFKLRGGDGPAGAEASDDSVEVEISEIRASDLLFVRGASSAARTDAYLLSRAPYSVCIRLCGDIGMGGDEGRPVACALMHSDGSIGALHVDSKHRRCGLGRLVIRALMEKLDFCKGPQGDREPSSNEHRDLGGGALGWVWMNTEASNEAGNRFFTSMVGMGSRWMCHWTYLSIDDVVPSRTL